MIPSLPISLPVTAYCLPTVCLLLLLLLTASCYCLLLLPPATPPAVFLDSFCCRSLSSPSDASVTCSNVLPQTRPQHDQIGHH